MKVNRGFTILELLVVVAIIGIIAVIALPNFIGRIEQAKASQNLAEINAVEKAIATYYADNGIYPTLQAKDGTLLQPQPLEGAPHNIDFSSLVPDYLASLPHFSYWWVDYQGNVYHTDKVIGSVSGNVFTPTPDYTYTLHKVNGTSQVLSAPYTLQAGEYIIGKEESGLELPKIGSAFKNAKMHPEDPEYVASIPVTGVTLNKTTLSIMQGSNETLLATILPIDATIKSVTWTSSNTAVATIDSNGKVVGVATGSATITATALDGGYTATCVVTVAVPVTAVTFNYTGSTQTYTVPTSGTYKLEVWGASGGTGTNASNTGLPYTGGAGGTATGNKSLTAGQMLYIYVGGSGITGNGAAGGWNGGGAVGNSAYSAGSGGGASDIRIGGTNVAYRQIVAGGGGGGGNCSIGGAGGGTSGIKPISSTQYSNRVAGVEGTQSSGFALGVGQGSNGQNYAGGGGGGYYGGGQGDNSTGGGGGSGYIGGVTGGTLTVGGKTGHGQVKITYVGP